MKPFIVVTDGMNSKVFSRLLELDGIEVYPQSKVSSDELKRLLPRVHGLIIRSATSITKDFLEEAPLLRYIVRAGEGVDNIDKKSCHAKGVKISNTPGANNNSAAEHAIALMFTLLRRTAWADASMKAGHWDKSKFVGAEMWKKKIGIVGIGKIGGIIAQRLSAFDVTVNYYDPYRDSFPASNVDKIESLEELFSSCDIITLHLLLNRETRGMISQKLLSLMQPHAILINAARGGLVDESALMKQLQDNKIGGAALDVYETEPLPAESPLRKLPNLVLTPHLGASTFEAQYRVGEMAVHQIREFFLNENLLNEVIP